uniref:Uncharacterized protein n=1 Tax=Anopheles farauti TaxID=69004 RepID=A0A182Q5X7_9DIPT
MLHWDSVSFSLPLLTPMLGGGESIGEERAVLVVLLLVVVVVVVLSIVAKVVAVVPTTFAAGTVDGFFGVSIANGQMNWADGYVPLLSSSSDSSSSSIWDCLKRISGDDILGESFMLLLPFVSSSDGCAGGSFRRRILYGGLRTSSGGAGLGSIWFDTSCTVSIVTVRSSRWMEKIGTERAELNKPNDSNESHTINAAANDILLATMAARFAIFEKQYETTKRK